MSRMSRQPQLALLGEATLLSLPSGGRGVPPSRQSSAEAAGVPLPRIVTSNSWPREATMHAPRGRRKRRASDLADVRHLKSEVFSSVAHSLIGFEFRVSGFWFLVLFVLLRHLPIVMEINGYRPCTTSLLRTPPFTATTSSLCAATTAAPRTETSSCATARSFPATDSRPRALSYTRNA